VVLAWLSLAHAAEFDDGALGKVHGWTREGALALEVNVPKLYYPRAPARRGSPPGPW
jgi:hypothetical protein